MRFTGCLPLLGVLLLAGCAAEPDVDHQAAWRETLRHKKAALAPEATAEHKQLYADAVRSFVEKHPEHGRAQEVWARLQLGFADDLAEAGRYQDAIRFYRAVLIHHPENEDARRGLAIAADRLAVSRDRLVTLSKGMSGRQVVQILGKPLPGWKKETRRGDARFEAWYYRTRAGAVAAVYFRNGKVIGAEESSDARLGRLGS